MPDREKVRGGLLAIKTYLNSQAIEAKSKIVREAFMESARNIDDALTLLKEQEAVAPNPVHNSFRWFACGKCDCSITREDRFCPRCGQAVKWND